MKTRRVIFFVILFALQFVINTGDGFTQNFPSKPIRLIVGFTAGGGNDIMARTIGKELGARWRQPVIIENRPGGGGTLAAGITAKAKPDGYTILFVASSYAILPSMHRRPTYDPVKDFAAITMISQGQTPLVAHPSLGVKSVKELITLAKTKPGLLSFASTGIGSVGHLRIELFKSTTGTDLLHIPYKGNPDAVIDLLAGRVSLFFADAATAVPYINAGKMRALAINGPVRSPLLPDVPTMTEAGIPGFETGSWYGLVAPAATPKEIIKKLNIEVVKILHQPDMKERLLREQGHQPVGNTPDEFTAFIKAELAKWAKVIKEAAIPVED